MDHLRNRPQVKIFILEAFSREFLILKASRNLIVEIKGCEVVAVTIEVSKNVTKAILRIFAEVHHHQ